MCSASGDVFVGVFKDDEMVEGTIEFENGDVYDGKFIDEEKIGQGKMFCKNQGLYEGEFLND